MKRYLTVVLAIALVLFLGALCGVLVATPASAYPTTVSPGWTSDVQVGSGSFVSVDIAAQGNVVMMAAETADHTIQVNRSVDGGVTWGGWVRVDGFSSATADSPQIIIYGPYVWVFYLTNQLAGGEWHNLACRRSIDGGASWVDLYNWYDLDTKNYSDLEVTKANNGWPTIAFCKTLSSGIKESYISWAAGNDSFTAPILVSPNDGINSGYPSPGMLADQVYCAYQDQMVDHNHIVLVNLPEGFVPRMCAEGGGESGYWPINPCLTSSSTGQITVSYATVGPGPFGSNYTVYSRPYWGGGSWGDATTIGTSNVYPEQQQTYNSNQVFFKNGNSIFGSGQPSTALMQRPSGIPWGSSFSVDLSNWVSCPPNYQHLAVISPSSGNIYYKRQDATPATGQVAVNGNTEGPVYVKDDFPVALNNVIDDWNRTDEGGNTNNGAPYWNGVTSVQMQYSLNGSTNWLPIGNIINNGSWNTSVSLSTLGGDGTYYLRGAMTDTAGNVGYTAGVEVVKDTNPPSTDIAVTGSTENAAGWRNKNTNIELRSYLDEPANPNLNLDHIEYKVEGTNGVGGAIKGSNWTNYAGPFTVGEGKYNITYKSINKSGLTDVTDHTASMNIDTRAPTAAVLHPNKQIVKTGFGNGQTIEVESMALDGNQVVNADLRIDGISVHPFTDGFENMKWDWNISNLAGKHTIEVYATDIAGNVGDGRGGASASLSVLVDAPSKDWYFAEGNTLPEFDEYLTIVNPGDRTATCQMDFMLEDGSVIRAFDDVAAHSRNTERVKTFVSVGHTGVSTHVHCDSQAIVVERPMYFNYRQTIPGRDWKGGTVAVGLNALQKQYYFAEGTTRDNGKDGTFDEWITIQNPGATSANVVLTYMLETGQNIDKSYAVAPHSRLTVDVARDVGINHDVSTRLVSDQPIAAERPMYFNYHGWALDGSNVVGTINPALSWYFAEGSTQTNSCFEEWITLMNPNDQPAKVDMTFFTASGKTIAHSQMVPGRTRSTVNVWDYVGANQDVSTQIESDVPVIAERPMYYFYQGKWNGGDVAVGAAELSTEYYLAEGTTQPGFDTWYCLGNPGDKPACVKVTYMFTGGKAPQENMYNVAPRSRLTVSVNQTVGAGVDVSAHIQADEQIMLERPMYFDENQTRPGGHTAQGYGVD